MQKLHIRPNPKFVTAEMYILFIHYILQFLLSDRASLMSNFKHYT